MKKRKTCRESHTVVRESARALEKLFSQKNSKYDDARTTKNFRPVAIGRLGCKTFAYCAAHFLFERIEGTLEQCQPEEHHRFRSKHRIEGHLLRANVVIDDKLLLAKQLWWFVNFDLCNVIFFSPAKGGPLGLGPFHRAELFDLDFRN